MGTYIHTRHRIELRYLYVMPQPMYAKFRRTMGLAKRDLGILPEARRVKNLITARESFARLGG